MATKTVQEPDEAWLKKRIQAVVRDGINSEDGEVTDVRQDVFSAYMGDLMGNERDGYSKIVTREVLQAIEWALPALMRVFLGGQKVLSFRASGPDDVEQAKQETDAVAYWFHDGNPEQSGFIVLYTYLKDLLMNPNAYMSVEATEEEEHEEQVYAGLNPAQIEYLEEQGWTVEELTTGGDDDEDGEEPQPTGEHRVFRSKMAKRVEVSALPPDMVIIDHGHNQLNLDRAKAVIIRDTSKTLSDARELGYDVEAEDLGPNEDDETWNDEATTRYFYTEEQPGNDRDSYDLEADTPVVIHTCYMRVDWDGDGRSELRRIVMVGCEIVENEPCDLQTVVAGSALPVPHKHIGMGYGELVLDLQQLMTTLTRQLLDNIYGQNIQRKYINEAALLSDGSTMDALLDGTNEFVLVRGNPAMSIMPEVTTPIVAEIGQVLELLRETPQLRTGVAPQLSLDPSVLEKSTMGAFMGALDQASQRLELLARLVAETGLKQVFLKIHHTLRTHFDEPQQIEVNGKWITIDPTKWKKRSSMTCNVGLGFNNKQVMLQLLQTLLAIQKEAIPTGLADVSKIYATLEMMVEHANLGHAGSYFNDPKVPGFKAPPPTPDPAMILAQAQAKALEAEAKRKDREVQAKEAMEREQAEAKATEMLNDFLNLKDKDRLTTAQVAKIMAEITNLNRDEKAQGEPAEDTSMDEFQRAAGLAGDTASEREADRNAKGGGKPDPEKERKSKEENDGRHKEVMDGIAKLAKPKRVVRDPATNRVTGVETVDDTPAKPNGAAPNGA